MSKKTYTGDLLEDLKGVGREISKTISHLRKTNKNFNKFVECILKVLDIGGKSKKEYLVDNALIILATYYVNKTLGYFFLCSQIADSGLDAMKMLFGNLLLLILYPFPSIRIVPLLSGIVTFFSLKFWRLLYKRPKNTKDGLEYGSAKWGNEEDIKPFINIEEDLNLILTKTERLSTNLHPPKGHPELGRNKNVLIYGAPGTGKSRGYAQPNIMQMFGSYIVTDPKGNTLEKTGQMLKDNGYDIRILNLKDMLSSNKYNPFHYIRKEEDILSITQILLQIGKKVNETSQSGDEFWKNAETLTYLALISYIFYTCPTPSIRTINTMLIMLRNSKVYEDKEDAVNAIDIMFRDLEYLPDYLNDPEKTLQRIFLNKDIRSPQMAERVKIQIERFNNLHKRIELVKERYPYIKALNFEGGKDCLPVSKYNEYKLAAGKTAKSILISCAARLAPLSVGNIKNLLSEDELDLYSIGRKNTKVAMFIVTSDTDSTFNFITTMLYYQMFTVLCDITADTVYRGELPVHVHFILDEFANIGLIPDFDNKISTIRSRNISATIILQAQSQLKAIYDKSWQTIETCCQTMLFLGSTDLELLKTISEKLGKETLDSYTQSYSYGQQKSENQNHQKLGRDVPYLFVKSSVALNLS
ncbi:MAG: type IV secretory system conjugative DNA transfer family protein [Clostridia bacterium]|nr:type IV secretory system conjugative DNA transfer family protein [Clostridia bacterium]